MTEPGVDEWRSQVLELAQGLSVPVQVVLLLVAFSLGAMTVRALS